MSLPDTPQVEVSHLVPSGPVPTEETLHTQTLQLNFREERIQASYQTGYMEYTLINTCTHAM